MSDESAPVAVDVGEYCRQVESFLTRVNGGHLVRIVGPGFELVRRWAEEGVPLGIVFRGIELKADRHRLGRSKRPLRIEFCAADVEAVYDGWRRAVGLPAAPDSPEDAPETLADSDDRRRPSLSKHLDRAIDRLARGIGRLDLPEALGGWLGTLIEELTTLREAARRARGPAREPLVARLAALDRELGERARAAAPPDLLTSLTAQAEHDLAPYRGRLDSDAWRRAVTITVDRLLRERLVLPILEA